MRKRLTQRQETFCLKYFELGNGSEAAIIAGYSKRNARVIASINLTKANIMKRLQELRQIAEDASIASVLERKQILTEIARARQTDFMICSADGVWMHDIGPETINKAALKQVQTSTMPFGDKEQNLQIILTKVELHDPIKAIAELNKMDRIYEPEGAEKEPIINNTLQLIFPEGTVVKPGRMGGDGHKPLEVTTGGDGNGKP